MRTIVYVDGFNLYYGALKNTHFKWLDLPLFFKNIPLPHHQILRVRYFTAKVSATKNNSQHRRQEIYLRALRAHSPNVRVHLGHFLQHQVSMPLVNPTKNRKKARVIKTEEKGSDVNLAVHLLNDVWLGECDCAVVVSNDSDLAQALHLTKKHTGIRIGLITPGYRRRTSAQLEKYADFVQTTRSKDFKKSQLPSPSPNTQIYKPDDW